VLVVRVPRDLPGERRDARSVSGDPLTRLEAITFDFGNTLVPVDRAGLSLVVHRTAEVVVGRLGPFAVESFLATWAEERDRQFREDVPQFREVDLPIRVRRVLARLRGAEPPPRDERWDDTAAAERSTAGEVDWVVGVYSEAFVGAMPPPDAVAPVLAALARRHRLGIVSNWPLARTIDRYVEAAGWDRWIGPIVVSQRVGTIKPHPAIFAAALDALGGPAPDRVLHVGDDWAADVVGAKEAGWRAAWITHRPADSPLPDSERDGRVTPDLEVADLSALAAALDGGQ
jgi:HAD superfamily hydrolase (TIGR01509 family)